MTGAAVDALLIVLNILFKLNRACLSYVAEKESY